MLGNPMKMPSDKQLLGIRLEDVLEKRRLDQAMNAKEFAVCAGVSCSIARGWFRLPGIPTFRSVVFWQDFAQWRTDRNQGRLPTEDHAVPGAEKMVSNLPPRAEQLLRQA